MRCGNSINHMKCHAISLTHYRIKVQNSELFYYNTITQSRKIVRKNAYCRLNFSGSMIALIVTPRLRIVVTIKRPSLLNEGDNDVEDFLHQYST